MIRKSHARLLRACDKMSAAYDHGGSLLARPAAFGKDDSPLVGGAAQRACQLEGFVTLRAWSHLARQFERICCRDVPIQPIPIR